MTLLVVRTTGHSADEVSYIINDSMFIGYTVPVKGDIPIYINREMTLNSLNIPDNTEGVNTFYPAWDKTYTKKEMSEKTEEARQLIRQIDSSLSKTDKNGSLDILVDAVCSDMSMPFLKSNHYSSERLPATFNHTVQRLKLWFSNTQSPGGTGISVRGSYTTGRKIGLLR